MVILWEVVVVDPVPPVEVIDIAVFVVVVGQIIIVSGFARLAPLRVLIDEPIPIVVEADPAWEAISISITGTL
jgi:hypothetical protein